MEKVRQSFRKKEEMCIRDSYENVWQETADYTVENTVMVHIRHIREKVEIDAKKPRYVKVVWGIGYKMEKYGKSN